MKAAVCREFGAPLMIEDVELAAPGAGQVLVDVDTCAICHSDIAFMDGIWGGHLPAVYGHEAAGVVAGLGAGVSDYAIGDRVAVTLIRSCGDCPSCKSGHPADCEASYDNVSGSPLKDANGEKLCHAMATSGFAEAVVVDQSQLAKLPDEVPMEEASLLSCGVITGYGAAANVAQVPAGANVVVVGLGGVGLNTVQAAMHAGADRVIGVDVEQEKLDGAMEFGATDGVLVGPDQTKAIMDLTNGRGADFVFVTVGAIRAFEGAVDMLAPRGEMIMVGMPPVGAKAEFLPVNVAAMSQAFKGSKMGDAVVSRDIPKLAQLFLDKRLKLTELISARFPLEKVNDAIAAARTGKLRRVILKMKGTV